MNINNPSTQQSSLAPLYPQTQQALETETRAEAQTDNPVEESKETSNEQPQARTGNSQQANGRIDTYA
jgi:hypothetical protein